MIGNLTIKDITVGMRFQSLSPVERVIGLSSRKVKRMIRLFSPCAGVHRDAESTI